MQWLHNESTFRVRDYQRTPKTEVLPLGYSLKSGRYQAGFFARRGLDDRQLHVNGSLAGTPRPLWRLDRRNNWLVYRDVFRQIYACDGPTEGEPALGAAVRSWASERDLLILPVHRSRVIQANNANVDLEKIRELPRPLLKYARQASLVEQPTLPGLGLQYCCSSCA